MTPQTCLADVDVVVLAGGLGTRLRSVLPDVPKILAPVGERVFLDILLDRLEEIATSRVILALGYRADVVEKHLASRPRTKLNIEIAIESEPLGTAGALRFVHPLVQSSAALVMNGDSLVAADLGAFIEFHENHGAAGTILCTRVPDAGRYGRVVLDGEGRIVDFREKEIGGGPGIINAGIYIVGRPLFRSILEMPGPSLERDIFQKLPTGALMGYYGDFPFIDIGTPDDLGRAPEFVARDGVP